MTDVPNNNADRPPRTLRTKIAEDPVYLEMFDQAQKLAESLLDSNVPFRKHLPHYTDHSSNHMRRIEEALDRMLFPREDQSASLASFDPTPAEAAFLLASVWLHDIGMVYGIFEDEKATEGKDIDWETIRTDHEIRASRYIQHHWRQHCSWSNVEKINLAEICVHHRRKHRFESFAPEFGRDRNGRQIRLRILGALLRLADACHIDATRTPECLRNFFDSVGMPVESKSHWGLPLLVESVDFNHSLKTIDLKCYFPRVSRHGTATIDFGVLVDRLADGLREELASVIPYLAPFWNVDFKDVAVTRICPDAMSNSMNHVRRNWANLLTTVARSGSEAASMVAALVLAACEGQRDIPREEVASILDFALKLHPHNLLIRKIDRDVRDVMGESESNVRKLVECKRRYLKHRQAECNRVAVLASSIIDSDDCLVFYGFSHIVATLISRHLIGHRGRIVVVHGPLHDDDRRENETERLEVELQNAGLDYVTVEMAHLPEIFSRLRREINQFKVFLGTRGVFNGGDVLGATGSALIAMAAKTHDGKVFVLAEEDKRAADSETKAIMEKLLNEHAEFLVQQGDVNSRSYQAQVPVDRLPPSRYDEIIGIEPLNQRSLVGGESGRDPLGPESLR
ncbi:MAG: hypothetical protein Fues2KO_04620 [Fuerstiella sp.]